MEVDNLQTSAHKIEPHTNIEKKSDHYPWRSNNLTFGLGTLTNSDYPKQWHFISVYSVKKGTNIHKF